MFVIVINTSLLLFYDYNFFIFIFNNEKLFIFPSIYIYLLLLLFIVCFFIYSIISIIIIYYFYYLLFIIINYHSILLKEHINIFYLFINKMKKIGESEKVLVDVFRTAKESSPCFIFFDEIDAIFTSKDQSNLNTNSSVFILIF